MTVQDLLARTSAYELSEWQEFWALEAKKRKKADAN